MPYLHFTHIDVARALYLLRTVTVRVLHPILSRTVSPARRLTTLLLESTTYDRCHLATSVCASSRVTDLRAVSKLGPYPSPLWTLKGLCELQLSPGIMGKA